MTRYTKQERWSIEASNTPEFRKWIKKHYHHKMVRKEVLSRLREFERTGYLTEVRLERKRLRI